MRKPTVKWQMLCVRLDERVEQMCEIFVDKYFWENADMHVVWSGLPWIMSWPLFVNDYYFSLEDVYAALWYDMPLECLTKYQDYKDDVIYNGEVDYNLKLFYHLIYKDACEDKSEKKENSYWPMTDRPHQRPSRWGYWGTAIWPFVWDNPFDTTDRPTTITLCGTTKCRSVELSSNDDSDDESAVRDDENDGWENEEVRRTERKHCCKRWGCWRNSCNKWRQHSHL